MTTPKANYSLDEAGRFTVENYNWAKPFSNFFPGIAGAWGIPMWVFYVSRGQGITSIGVRDKDHSIMEFLSFNKALQVVGKQGFRTFLRIDGGPVYEPFQKVNDPAVEQSMTVSSHGLEIIERNSTLQMEISVTYYPLVNTPIAGLVRRVSIANFAPEHREFAVIDGLPKILPYGVTFEHTKVIARHIEGMMGAFEVAGVPIFRLKQTPSDAEQVGEISGGNFYLSVSEEGELLGEQMIVDPYLVFADAEAHDFPWSFAEMPLDKLLETEQIRENRTPSALTALRQSVAASEVMSFSSIVGFAQNDETLAALADQATKGDFLATKRVENKHVIEKIKQTAFTVSGEPAFDQYVQQTFLDNVMRGGMPTSFKSGDENSIFYIYARQNGDLERDYHWFVLEPTYLSQGNGHYRSILQNRRMDGWFFPEIQDFNLVTYMNLIQTDGYNPLVVNGFTYTAADKEAVDAWLSDNVSPAGLESLEEMVRSSFTPGEFIGGLEAIGEPIERPYEELLAELLSYCRTNEIGALHEGYWQDHWFYNLDTIDTFRMVYPDRWLEALIERRVYSYFDDPDVVQSREHKTVLINGKVRQYGAVLRDDEKQALIGSREFEPNKLRTKFGAGEIYHSNLLVKLLCIIANRISSLDRAGVGVEMEAGKPGWLDSLNGLPGIFGSSLNETLEIERVCQLLLDNLSNNALEDQPVFEELATLIRDLTGALSEWLSSSDAFEYWERSQSLKETYREATRLGISGKDIELSRAEILAFLNNCLAVIRASFEAGPIRDKSGLPYTYYITDIGEYEASANGEPQSENGAVPVRPLTYEHRPMAPFLEGPVHMMRMHSEDAKSIYDAVRSSELFDRQLQMYRCCAWLKDEPYEIGRIKSYARGWIENESIYTHMEYKWLLEVLRSGLHEEFFDDIQKALVPFLDPEMYGRSVIENCSFIASSVFPDRLSHGRAFQPRLSGVTSEFLNMWALMVAGENPFYLDSEGELALRLRPILDHRFFTGETSTHTYLDAFGDEQSLEITENSFAFKFLGGVLVIYENPGQSSTYGENGVRPAEYSLTYLDGTTKSVKAASLDRSLAEDVRGGKVSRIDVLLER